MTNQSKKAISLLLGVAAVFMMQGAGAVTMNGGGSGGGGWRDNNCANTSPVGSELVRCPSTAQIQPQGFGFSGPMQTFPDEVYRPVEPRSAGHGQQGGAHGM